MGGNNYEAKIVETVATPSVATSPSQVVPVVEPSATPVPPKTYLAFSDLEKVELRVGTVTGFADVPKSDKLYALTVDFGEATPRTVLAGVKKTFTGENLMNKQFLFVTNLEPRKMMGLESQGMILAIGSDPTHLSLLAPTSEGVAPGSSAK